MSSLSRLRERSETGGVPPSRSGEGGGCATASPLIHLR